MEAIWICYVGIGVEGLIVNQLQLLGVLVFTLVHTVSALLLGICCVGQWVRNESRGKDPFKNVVMQSRRRKGTYPLVRPCVFPQLQRNQPEFCLRKPIDTALAPRSAMVRRSERYIENPAGPNELCLFFDPGILSQYDEQY